VIKANDYKCGAGGLNLAFPMMDRRIERVMTLLTPKQSEHKNVNAGTKSGNT
jgi:hypothetical protein